MSSKFLHALLVGVLLFAAPHASVAQENKLPFPIPRSAAELPRGAVIETTKGPIEISFYREDAPIAVRNFQYLAQKNFYRNLTFHRQLTDYVVQGGDPLGTGKGGTGYLLPPEFTERRHLPGTVGMARLDDRVNLERLSNGSQFYIMLAPARHLDGAYTVFAEVRTGLDVARALRVGDRIIQVTVIP